MHSGAFLGGGAIFLDRAYHIKYLVSFLEYWCWQRRAWCCREKTSLSYYFLAEALWSSRGVTWLFWAAWRGGLLPPSDTHVHSNVKRETRSFWPGFITAGLVCHLVSLDCPLIVLWFVLNFKGKKRQHTAPLTCSSILTRTYKDWKWLMESMCVCRAGMCCASE